MFPISPCRWSRRQCRRRGLDVTEENTRLVVAGSQYLVRYLTMTLRQGLEHSRGIENLIYFPFFFSPREEYFFSFIFFRALSPASLLRVTAPLNSSQKRKLEASCSASCTNTPGCLLDWKNFKPSLRERDVARDL